MKMYIAVKESVPLGFAMVGVAHAAIIAHLNWGEDRVHKDYQHWREHSFKKVVLKVSDKEFEKLKSLRDAVVVTESALEEQQTCVVLCPRDDADWPKFVRFLRMYKE